MTIGPIATTNDKNENRTDFFYLKFKDFHDIPVDLRSDNDIYIYTAAAVEMDLGI